MSKTSFPSIAFLICCCLIVLGISSCSSRNDSSTNDYSNSSSSNSALEANASSTMNSSNMSNDNMPDSGSNSETSDSSMMNSNNVSASDSESSNDNSVDAMEGDAAEDEVASDDSAGDESSVEEESSSASNYRAPLPQSPSRLSVCQNLSAQLNQLMASSSMVLGSNEQYNRWSMVVQSVNTQMMQYRCSDFMNTRSYSNESGESLRGFGARVQAETERQQMADRIKREEELRREQAIRNGTLDPRH